MSLVAQLGAILGLVLVGVSVAFYAESGRQAPFLRGAAILLVLGAVLVALGAFVGALRTVKGSAAEP